MKIHIANGLTLTIIEKLVVPMIHENLLQCDRGEYEPPWEDWQREQEENQRQWRIEKECRLKESLNLAFVAERQLHEARYTRDHTDRQLRDLSKRIKSSKRALCEQYRSEFGSDRLSVFLEDCETSTETFPAFSRDIRNPTRRDKRRMNKNLRQRARQLEFLTQRGCSPRQVRGITEDRSFTEVVAAV